jgi:hypothetical protein
MHVCFQKLCLRKYFHYTTVIYIIYIYILIQFQILRVTYTKAQGTRCFRNVTFLAFDIPHEHMYRKCHYKCPVSYTKLCFSLLNNNSTHQVTIINKTSVNEDINARLPP